MIERLSAGGVVAAVLLASGCGSTPPPTERMATAQAGVRVARETGADEVPQARLHVRLAEQQIQQAAKLIDEGKHEEADWVLQGAAADAQLARALARQAEARVDLEEEGGEQEMMP